MSKQINVKQPQDKNVTEGNFERDFEMGFKLMQAQEAERKKFVAQHNKGKRAEWQKFKADNVANKDIKIVECLMKHNQQLEESLYQLQTIISDQKQLVEALLEEENQLQLMRIQELLQSAENDSLKRAVHHRQALQENGGHRFQWKLDKPKN